MKINNIIDRMKLPFRKEKELYSSLYAILGFYPRDISIYKQALMHRSAYKRNAKGRLVNNERLEFLGDAILDAIVGDIVFRHFEGKREGFLTSTRSKIVQRDTLNRLANEIGVSRLIVSHGHMSAHNSYMEGNAFEALVGAIYLDRGYAACMRFMQRRILSQIINLDKVAYKEVNFKSKLLEWCQKNKVNLKFELTSQRRDENNSPVFVHKVLIEGLEGGTGEGSDVVEGEGVKLCAAVKNPPGAARGTLFFLHGVASNASRWEEFVETTPLGADWRLLRYDLRGHGASVTAEPPVIERHVADVLAVMDAAGVDRCVLVGHSLGGHIAMYALAQHPERFEGAILLDPLVTEALTEKAEEFKRRRPLVRFLEICGRVANAVGLRRKLPHYSLRRHDEVARAMLAKGGVALEAFIREFSAPTKDLGHIHLAYYARDLLETGRPSPDLSGLQLPVLVVTSSAGSFTDPDRLVAWARRLPHGSATSVQCLHWPMTECPDDVSREMTRWLNAEFPKSNN